MSEGRVTSHWVLALALVAGVVACKKSAQPHIDGVARAAPALDLAGESRANVVVEVKVLVLRDSGGAEPLDGFDVASGQLAAPSAWECAGASAANCPPKWFKYVGVLLTGGEAGARKLRAVGVQGAVRTGPDGKAKLSFVLDPGPEEAGIIEYVKERVGGGAMAPDVKLEIAAQGVDALTGRNVATPIYASYPRTVGEWLVPVVLPECALSLPLSAECEDKVYQLSDGGSRHLTEW